MKGVRGPRAKGRKGAKDARVPGRCYWCNCELVRSGPATNPRRATREHLLPRSKGGSDHRINIVPACTRCNHLRADREDYLIPWSQQGPNRVEGEPCIRWVTQPQESA